MSEEELPAWSLSAAAVERIALPEEWPGEITRDWAWGGATGAGARVCVLDSGIEDGHPLVGKVQQSVAISIEGDEVIVDEEDTQGDLCGHGTACAGVIRSLAPECDLVSVRVLGAGYTGSGAVLLEGLKWAIEQGYDVINMSLSTTKQKFASLLHELADTAYFQRTMLVASAHNMPVESYPWRFSSVISVGSHEGHDPLEYYYNPAPPVEFFARGVDVEVAWNGGGRLVCTGKQLRHPARRGHRRAHPVEASRADAVPAEERPLPGGEQRGGRQVSDDLRAAVAAGVLGAEEQFQALLQSIVDVARAIFKAKASSIFLLDEEADELVFEAVAGEGSDSLVGQRFPSSTGIAGFVLVSRQPLVIEDVLQDPRFSRETAESTGFVPKGLMAVPLLHEERALGVLEVLDRPQDTRFTLAEMDLLGLFANQAAIALDLLQRARRAQAALAGEGDLAVVARVAETLEQQRDEEDGSRESALRLLAELEKLL